MIMNDSSAVHFAQLRCTVLCIYWFKQFLAALSTFLLLLLNVVTKNVSSENNSAAAEALINWDGGVDAH